MKKPITLLVKLFGIIFSIVGSIVIFLAIIFLAMHFLGGPQHDLHLQIEEAEFNYNRTTQAIDTLTTSFPLKRNDELARQENTNESLEIIAWYSLNNSKTKGVGLVTWKRDIWGGGYHIYVYDDGWGCKLCEPLLKVLSKREIEYKEKDN